MKATLLTALLACASLAARAQASATQIEAIKALVTSKTWKTQSTKINGLSAADFESINNIHKVDMFPTGNRFKFNTDGTFVIIMASGGSKIGVWEISDRGQLVFNPGQDGGVAFGISNASPTAFTGKHIKPLGLCSVTSLYEIVWVAAQ